MAIKIEAAEAALKRARRSKASLQYFFSQLTSPDWIEPLRELKVFDTPAQPVREEGSIMFPDWPESAYLARMAGVAPKLVLDTIRRIPATDSFVIHSDYIEAALKMPLSDAAQIAKMERKWIQSQTQLFGSYPEKAGALFAKISAESLPGALNLAKALLALTLSERSKGLSRDVVAKFDAWHYDRVLRANLIGEVGPHDPLRILKFLGDLLDNAIKLKNSRYSDFNETAYEDLSTIWRSHIAGSRQGDIVDALVSAVRDSALHASSVSANFHLRTLETLRLWNRRVFSRIEKYVIAESPNSTVSEVLPLLTKHESYQQQGEDNEFDLLLRKWFSRLGEEEQAQILAIIRKGIDESNLRERWRKFKEREITKSELADVQRSWKVRWWQLISESLPPAELEEFKQATAQAPAVERMTSGAFVGVQSPLTAKQVSEMEVQELVTFLKEFTYTDDWISPSPEGLGRTLTSVVSQLPERYAAHAASFISLNPTYVRGLVEGLQNAIKEQRPFDWVSVIALCKWVVQQPIQTRMIHGHSLDEDPDWSWTRKSIGWLLIEALQANVIPQSFSADIVELIRPMTEQADPPYAEEPNYVKEQHFAAYLAFNTVRGVALTALGQYVIWAKDTNAIDLAKPIFDRHLDISFDPSFVSREVVGRYLPWLAKADRDWIQQRVPLIFPEGQPDYRLVAWQNYILFTNPYDDVLPFLEGEYKHAISNIGKVEGRDSKDAERALASHIMTFFWRGRLQLPGEGLVSQFFSTATPDIRGHAIRFLGQSLQAVEGAISPEVLERLRNLWEERKLNNQKDAANGEELAEFGWWFLSQRFEFGWALDQLLWVLETVGEIQPDFEVAKVFAARIDDAPERILQAMFLMVKGDKKGWPIYGWIDEAREILSSAVTKDGATFERAKAVIDALVAKGFYEFRSILRKQN